MKPLDKKQFPQVIVLAVLALGLFGYFAKALFLPGPVSAKGPAPAPAGASAGASAKPAVGAAISGAPADAPVPLPSANGRDPFVPAVSSGNAAASVQAGLPKPAAAPAAAPAPRLASLRLLPPASISIPAAPALPFPAVPAPVSAHPAGFLPPLPVAPSWTVTGVLQSGPEHIAILRSGDTRRFVKQGDYIDDRFQVAQVTRSFVVLRTGKSAFTLPLGGTRSKGAVSEAPTRVPAVPSVAAPAPAPSQPQLPRLALPPAPQDMSRAAPARLKMAIPALRPLVTASEASGSRTALRLPTIKVADARGEWRAPVAVAAGRPQVHPSIRAAALVRAPKAVVTQYAPSTLPSLLPIGSPAPDFSLPTLSGRRVALSELRGRVVLLHFWASWVSGYAEDLAQLRRLQTAYGEHGLTVLNVNSWDNLPALRGAFSASGSPRLYDQVYDPGLSNVSVAVCRYHAADVPALYLIDRNGNIAAGFTQYDAQTRAALTKALHAQGVAY